MSEDIGALRRRAEKVMMDKGHTSAQASKIIRELLDKIRALEDELDELCNVMVEDDAAIVAEVDSEVSELWDEYKAEIIRQNRCPTCHKEFGVGKADSPEEITRRIEELEKGVGG